MQETPLWHLSIAPTGVVSPVCTAMLLILACCFATGCTVALAPLAKSTVAFSTATAAIVDHSEDAYRAANRLHREEQTAKAVAAFDNEPQWNPYDALQSPLLTQEQLDARFAVLDALKVYAQSLVNLTDRKKQFGPLDANAAAAGKSLQALDTAATPGLQKLFPGVRALSVDEAGGVSKAIAVLGGLLIDAEIRKGLRSTTQAIDPSITSLCMLIEQDVKILRRQADVDYQALITRENQVILHNKIDPVLRRGEIAKLIELAAEQQANDALLQKLQKAIGALATTHHALTVAAQGSDAASVKQHIADLIAASQALGNYYKAL